MSIDTRGSNTPSSLVSAFGELLGEKRVSSMRPLVNHLRAAYDPTPKQTFYRTTNQGETEPYESFPPSPTYLQEWVTNLPSLRFEEGIDSEGSSVVSVQYKEFSGSAKITNSLKVAAEGSYGIVYKGAAGMYKLLRFDYIQRVPPSILATYHTVRQELVNADKVECYESFLKEYLLEAFIQRTLTLDPTMGHRVCKIHKLFRDSSVTRKSETNPSFYYSLERIPFTMRQFMEVLVQPRNLSNLLWNVSAMFLQVEEAVTYFKERYGFFHNDLHAGNVLFTSSFEPKLIDFGRSSITLGGVFYSMDKNPTEESFDLLIFLTSVYVFYSNYFTPPVQEALRGFFQEGPNFNLLDELEKRKSRAGIRDITHCMYPDYIMSDRPTTIWNIPYKEAMWSQAVTLRTVDEVNRVLLRAIDPLQFRAYWGQFVQDPGTPGSAGTPGTAGSNTTMTGGKRRTRSRKV